MSPDEPAPQAPATDKAAKKARFWAETKMDLKWASVVLFVLVLIGGVIIPPLLRLLRIDVLLGFIGINVNLGDGGFAPWYAPTSGEEELTDTTTEIFAQDGLVVPFEVLSVLLLAALIAGIVIALREREGDA